MFGSRICVSGIDLKSRRFVRPVTPTGLYRPFTMQGDTQVVRHFNAIEMRFKAYTPEPVYHTEEWRLDEQVAPRLVSRLSDSQLRIVCQHVATVDLNQAIAQQSRSLFIVRVERILGLWHEHYEKFKLRMTFMDAAGVVHERVPVNDLLILAKTQWEFAQGNTQYLNQVVQTFNNNPDRYLRIGLTREYKGQRWKQVTGLITLPDLFNGDGYARYEQLLRHTA